MALVSFDSPLRVIFDGFSGIIGRLTSVSADRWSGAVAG